METRRHASAVPMPTIYDRQSSEESQATQLIQNVLDPIARLGGVVQGNKPEDSLLNNSLADSSSTGRSTHIRSRYHLHGLAQTQSQSDEEDEMNQGSQKENVNGGGRPDVRDYTGGRPVSSFDHPTKTKTKGRPQDQPNQSRPRTKEAKHPSKLDEESKSFMQAYPRNSKPSSRQRSSSVSSQDSFAGDPPDPERRLLSSAKQFQVPLSELARAPGFGQRPGTEGNSNSSTSSFPPLMRSSVAGRSPSKVKVLVSPSSESDSYSQDLRPPVGVHNQSRRGGDIMMEDEEMNSQASSSAPGSSMYEHRDPEPDDLQATQPTTPSDEEANGSSDPPWLLAAARASVTAMAGEGSTPKGTANSAETKSSTSGGRPLISLIDPNNKWRFKRYQHIMEAQPGEAGSSGVVIPGSSDNQETQPSLEDEEALPLQRGPQRPIVPVSSALYREQEQRRSGIFRDAIEVVPDSEPSREEPPSLVFDAAGGQASRQFRTRTSTSQQQNGTSAKPTTGQNDDSDDDVPLAEISAHQERRDKERGQKQKGSLLGVSKPSSRPSGRIQESAEIPSSVPEQDALIPRPPRSAKGDSKGKRTTENVTRKDEKAYAAPGRRVMRRINEEEVEESKSESEQVKKFEDSESDGAADKDYQDVEAQASSRKRKRGTVPAKSSVPPRRKGPTTRGTKSATGTAKTTLARQSKRQRSTTTSTVKSGTTEATRVFALWRQDGHFYSGTVHLLQPDNRYLVKFDDETEAVVSVEQMRLRELRVGDDVLLPMRTRSSKVVGLSKTRDDAIIVDIDGDTEEVEIMNIRIASRTIKSAWKDRSLAIEDVVPAIPPVKTNGSPAPSGESLASAHSNKSARKKLLCKTGIVISLSAGNANREKDKESLISTIRNNGGVLLDDWTSVVRMEGKHMVNNNRWILNRDEVQWIGKDDIDRVFLLADDSSQKPKFLMAIGLGIPCLSVNWLHDSISTGDEKDWTAYMLTQGYSDRLSARISQQVDVDWGNSVHQLTDIMDNAVPAKVFSNQSILCIGADMVPQPKGKRLVGTDEKTQEASNAVARIIMCMGAHRVEAVTEPKHASMRLADYNYVVLKDSCTSGLDIKGTVVVTWSWVKECLIASRCLQLEEALSQEA